MTAVPSQRQKTKDSFQMELDHAIAKRKSAGLATGFSDDDDDAYEDDFEDEDEVDDMDFLKKLSNKTYTIPKKSKSKKGQLPSYLDEDDDGDDFILDGSKFVKKPKEQKQDFIRGSKPKLDETSARKPTDTGVEDNPLLSLLYDDSKKTLPQSKANLYPVTAAPRSNSPSFRDQDVLSSLKNTDRAPSPIGRTSSGDRLALSKSYANDSRDWRKSFQARNERTRIDEILSPVQRSSQENKENLTSGGLSKPKDSQSIIDFLMDDSPAPVPAPRKKDPKEEREGAERPRSRSGSDGKSGKKQKAETRSPSPQDAPLGSGRKSKSPPRPKTPVTETKSLLGNLPSFSGSTLGKTVSLQPSTPATDPLLLSNSQSLVSGTKRSGTPTGLQRSSAGEKELGDAARKEASTADDLLALFGQTSTDVVAPMHGTPSAAVLSETPDKVKSPVAEVAEITAEQSATGTTKQRPSRQLDDNVIDNVATYNLGTAFDGDQFQKGQTGLDRTEHATPPRPSSKSRIRLSKKSPRTPPVNYPGLGSLSGLKQLHQRKEMDESLALNSTADLRNSVYMNWLADREKERRKKAKIVKEEQERETEKKNKEETEKHLENMSARTAWMEQKEKLIKEQMREKRKAERKEREKKLREEEDKWKSQKKCEAIRKKKLEEAKQRYKEEQKKKHEEELLQKDKEKKKREESHRAMDEWMKGRSKQWAKDRRQESREKKKEEKEIHKKKEEEAEKAKEKYQEWREKKESQMRDTRRTVRHDDERPPWSPANKIIPRQR